MIQKLLLATNNEKKLNELKSLFVNTPIKITSLKEEGIDLSVEETGSTFEENAILKAEAYSKATNLPTLADQCDNELVLTLAKKYGKTPAQISLNWLVSKPCVVTIPRAMQESHINENLEALEFDLADEDIKLLDRVTK